MWRSWLTRQSGKPEVVSSSPADGESWQWDKLSQERAIRGLFLWPCILPHPQKNCVPENLRIVSVSDSVVATAKATL